MSFSERPITSDGIEAASWLGLKRSEATNLLRTPLPHSYPSDNASSGSAFSSVGQRAGPHSQEALQLASTDGKVCPPWGPRVVGSACGEVRRHFFYERSDFSSIHSPFQRARAFICKSALRLEISAAPS